jgi:hypothetical protein
MGSGIWEVLEAGEIERGIGTCGSPIVKGEDDQGPKTPSFNPHKIWLS